MGVFQRIRCPCCGTPRPEAAFGLTDDDDDAPLPEPAVLTCQLGGRGRCRWDEGPLALTAALKLRRRLRAATKYLDSLLEAAGVSKDERDAA